MTIVLFYHCNRSAADLRYREKIQPAVHEVANYRVS